MKPFICVLHLIVCTCFAKAQKITGYIKDTRQQPVPGATVLLQLAQDSSVIKVKASDINGYYTFSPVPMGEYFVTITNIGFNTGNSGTFYCTKNDIIIPLIAIEKNPGRLNEVVINSKKPLIEVNADKTIFNVEGSINAGDPMLWSC